VYLPPQTPCHHCLSLAVEQGMSQDVSVSERLPVIRNASLLSSLARFYQFSKKPIKSNKFTKKPTQR
jgi:hypothetical protein